MEAQPSEWIGVIVLGMHQLKFFTNDYNPLLLLHSFSFSLFATRGLMGNDDFKNLGFHDNDTPNTNSNKTTSNHSDASTTKESFSSQRSSSPSSAGKS